MNQYHEITGVILAGGKSSRMGKNKGLLPLKGKTFIRHITDTLQNVFHRVIIITNQENNYDFLKLEIFNDIYQDCGPLGGIHAAFVHSKARSCFFVSCDIPFITSSLIDYIIRFESDGAVIKIPSMGNKIHPLCGLYQLQCLTTVEHNLIKRNLKVRNTLDCLDVCIVPIVKELTFYHTDLLKNFNDLKDYEKINPD